MNLQQLEKIRIVATAIIGIAVWALLFWQYSHDGVPIHYLLHNKDLPALSNWWGGVVLPLLTWLLIGRINTRILQSSEVVQGKVMRTAIVGFVVSVAYGAAMSASYNLGYEQITSVLFPGILALALFFKIYREECALGFILSMSLVFGALLPTLFGVIFAVVGAVIYHLTRFLLSRIGLISA